MSSRLGLLSLELIRCVFAGTGAVESRLRAGRRGKETGRMVAPRSLSFTEG